MVRDEGLVLLEIPASTGGPTCVRAVRRCREGVPSSSAFVGEAEEVVYLIAWDDEAVMETCQV
jgi:hypothetical protein